jgi:alkylation response protein AidB-like acyl-CoA dehydrogenase
MLSVKSAGQCRIGATQHNLQASTEKIYTIFEGTSEIQRLVIARAISGMRIR